MEVTENAVYDSNKTYLVITVANSGRRPVTISRVWLSKNSEDTPALLLTDSFGGERELQEGKSTTYLGVEENIEAGIAAWKYVCVEDGVGIVHRRRLTKVLEN